MSRSFFRSASKIFKQNRASRKPADHRRRRSLRLEPLEGRALLAVLVADAVSGTADTTVGGTVYEDLDSNGAKGADENGIAGWTIYLDLDHSGTLNSDPSGTLEPSAVTDQDGNYLIRYLQPGNYRVAEIVPDGWTATSPVSVDVEVLLNRDSQADFFNFGGGDIIGTIWNDLNNDGVRDLDSASGEFTDPPLQGWTVFLDLNNNRAQDSSEPATLTDASGVYSFTDLPSGDYEVFEVLPDGWEAAKGFDNKQTAAVAPLQQTTLDFANVGIGVGSLHGRIWHDVNLDGVRNTAIDTGEFTEPGLADWSVFLDLNLNGLADPVEPTATTDTNGTYAFLSLPEGDYDVAEMIPAGWEISPEFDTVHTVSVRANRDAIAPDFANFSVLDGSIRGVVWNDLNRNGARDRTLSGTFTDPGLAGWTVYLDLNNNDAADASDVMTVTDANGEYFFGGLQIGDYDVREILPSGWEVSPTYSDSETVAVFSGTESIAPDFANFNVSAASPGSVQGTVWNDVNGNGVRDRDAATGEFAEPGLAGWTIFIDANSNGLFDSGESQTTSATSGSYTLSGILPGSVSVVAVTTPGWHSTAPRTSIHTIVLKSGQERTGLDFGNQELRDSTIRGVVFADKNRDGERSATERGLADIVVYLDSNHDGHLDAGEPQTTTSADLFYTPNVDEAGTYSFSHLAKGTYTVRMIVPTTLSATPASELEHVITITAAEDRSGVDTAAVFRRNEIHGTKFEDLNGNHLRDTDEPGMAGSTIFLDLDRDDLLDVDEPTTLTLEDGSYAFTDLGPGAYVVREVVTAGYERTFPITSADILWPAGDSTPAVGNVTPLNISASLAEGEILSQTVSLTLPDSGALTNLVDVFLLFDDTGSFVYNSPIVRGAFPDIISRLQAVLPGIDLGFGVGRFEEYGNFGFEYSSGRPFILNQPIVAASTAGYMTAIQAALDRTTPGYGGDQPETDIEALYQVVTGAGFDGNNNGSVLDSGVAGLAATQVNPGVSGDVPSFASFTADPTASVLPADGTIGGAGFRAGALPIILTATDTGFAYQPMGETLITGVGGLSLPVSQLTETSRPTTPFGSGAGIQETVTALNALGALVIGLGTNPDANFDPRQGLESLSKLTGAINRSTTTIENGTSDPIAPGDPLYFQIASGFSASVANGVVNAIQNAVTSVAVDITIQASDPRVKLTNHTGVVTSVSSGQTATFDIQLVGDGVPHRFDLQFVRAGTNVVLGSIPVVLGTPVAGSGYEFEDLEEGEIEFEDDFGDHKLSDVVPNVAPSFTAGPAIAILEDSGSQTVTGWATAISAGPASESWQSVSFTASSDVPALFSVQPVVASDGTLSFTPAADAFGTTTVSIQLHDNGGTVDGGVDSSAVHALVITLEAVNDAPVAGSDSYTVDEDAGLVVTSLEGLLANDTDADLDPLSAVRVSGPSHGSLTLNGDGSFEYLPAAGLHGSDTFTYVANDGAVDSVPAVVSITVESVNDAPVAGSDSYTVDEDAGLVVTSLEGLLANDTDADLDPLSTTLVSGPTHGSLTLNGDGSFVYLPAAGFHGSDTFTYIANDGLVDSIPAVVSITVQSVNDAPVAGSDSYTVDEDAGLVVTSLEGLLANDTDADLDPLSTTLVSGPTHGSLTLNGDGSFVYLPAAGFHGSDTFTYIANDGLVDSIPAVVSIAVASVNDAPIAGSDSYTVEEGTELVVAASSGLLANDTDADLDPLSAVLVSGPSHGSLTLNGDGSFTYVPVTGFFGTDSFVYQVSDGILASDGMVVTLDVHQVTSSGPNFLVVDRSARDLFEYDSAGDPVDRKDLSKLNRSPRGVTSTADGSVRWVIDSGGAVFVYDQSGQLIGSWLAKGISRAEGLAIDGPDLLVLDGKEREILRYANGAEKRSGLAEPTSYFQLDDANKKPMDIATDGTHLWVVDDGRFADRVLRYSMDGDLEGNWRLDRRSSQPTGLTIAASDADRIWIVDAGTDRVYQYDGAKSQLAGAISATGSFRLAVGNRDPQGIIDPLPPAAGGPTSGGIDLTDVGPISHRETRATRTDEGVACEKRGSKAPDPVRPPAAREHASESEDHHREHDAERAAVWAALARCKADAHDKALSELVEESDDDFSASIGFMFGKSHHK